MTWGSLRKVDLRYTRLEGARLTNVDLVAPFAARTAQLALVLVSPERSRLLSSRTENLAMRHSRGLRAGIRLAHW